MKLRIGVSLLCAIPLCAVTMLAVPTQTLRAQTPSADDAEVRQFALTLDKAQRAASAVQTINQMAAKDPSLNAAMDSSSGTTGKKPITQQAHDIDTRFPTIAAVIKQNGFQTREFIVVVGALVNDLGWVSMKKNGMVKAYPPGMITAANAALIENNWAAFQAIAAKLSPPQ